MAERLIFKSVCFLACLLAAVFLFTETAASKAVAVVEQEKPLEEAEKPPEPEKHGGRINPWMKPIVRAPPEVKTLPSMYR